MQEYIRWANPGALKLLWLTPGLVLLYAHAFRARRRALAALASAEALAGLVPARVQRRWLLRAVLMSLGLVLLVVAAARPQVGAQLAKVERKGVDVVAAIDTSASMLARDVAPDRLTVARNVVRALISRMRGDRIGIVTFAADAFVYCPLTIDYEAALMFLDALQPQVAGQAGTSLSAALDTAVGALAGAEHQHQQVVIVSDGEDQEGGVEAAAKRAAEKGIKVHTIGVGTPEGAPVPVLDTTGKITGHKRDSAGRVVLTTLKEEPLRTIASTTGGVYVRAQETGVNIDAVYAQIESAEARTLGTYQFTEYQDRFQWPLLAAILLITIEAILGDVRRKDV